MAEIKINRPFVYNIYRKKLLYKNIFKSIIKTIANIILLTMTSENVAWCTTLFFRRLFFE